MAGGKNPIDEFLLYAEVIIFNADSDSIIKPRVAVYGFTDAKFEMGKTLYREALDLHNAQKQEYGEQVAATTELNELWVRADRQYMKTLKIARIALAGNPMVDQAMMLYGIRKESLPGWLEQARAFYGNIIKRPEYLEAMRGYGYTKEMLIDEGKVLDQIEAKILQKRQETGEAQAATKARDKKIDELAKFVAELRAVAKVALADDPQQLEKLGILARSSPAARSQKTPESGPSA